MKNKINCEGLIQKLDFIKSVVQVLDSRDGFVITIPGRSEPIIPVPTSIEKDVRTWIHALLISEIRGLSVYTIGEPQMKTKRAITGDE